MSEDSTTQPVERDDSYQPGASVSTLVLASPDVQVVSQRTPWYRSTWFAVLILVFVPPVGLVLMWVLTSWKRYAKVLVTVPLLLTSSIFLLIVLGMVSSSVKDAALMKGEAAKMESFLGQKYGKDFIVGEEKISSKGDVFLGVRFKVYEAEVRPVDDRQEVFTASRIVEGRSFDGGVDSPDKLNYSDNYALERWTRELEGDVKSVIKKQSVDVLDTDFRVSIAKNRQSIAAFYDRIWGTTPTYGQLPADLKQQLSLSASIKATGTVDARTINNYAGLMLAVRDALDPDKQGLSVQVNPFEVYRDRLDKKPGWEWQNVSHVKLSEVQSVTELTPYFVQWNDGYGKYFNPTTQAFDLNHPEGV